MPNSRHKKFTWAIEHDGKEVHVQNRLLRGVLTSAIFLTSCAGALGAVVAMMLSVIIGAIMHPFLRLAGRKGFIHYRHGYLGIKVDREAFQRR